MNIRIIPRLDIKGPNLVKGISFEGLRVLGKPERFARYYYENGADELIYMDAVASLYGRNSLLEIIEKTAREIFIPLTVGGGLRSLDDIRAVLRAGADKISLNTAVIAYPDLIKEASRTFGSSTIVVSIEAIRNTDGTYEACVNYGRDRTDIDVFKWAVRAVELGAGELMITSINREGTGNGFDKELISRIAELVSVPVIAGGGAGKISDIYDVIIHGKAEAVALASILHYNLIRTNGTTSGDYTKEGNIEFLKQGKVFSKIQDASIDQIKSFLSDRGIACRSFLEKPMFHQTCSKVKNG
ncbi:MAG: imidazole glycerol phosphate synthase cyclase subunit [Syntrophales bacterium]|jgi:cyclase|nr:imidazole glycerol phosphate synthase cyclase subunit [Syntrophales bacterium]MDY0043771.1 imidazole glycerol phosphate synthase cyclase subunit [Syntrophales bacterium]